MEMNVASARRIREIEEEVVIEEVEEEESIYIAVKKELKEGKPTLLWLLQNINKEKKVKIVIIHVHIPAQMIPMMGGKFPASKVKEEVVNEHRQKEREKMHEKLDDYLTVCSKLKVKAEKLVVEADDVANGLIELISLHGIPKLVMGAAADKHYSRKMKIPKSKTAITVTQQADPSCKIWFVCKGTLICTREALLDTSSMGMPSPQSSLNSSSSPSDQLRSRSLPQSHVQTPVHDLSRHRSLPHSSQNRTLITRSRLGSDASSNTDPWDEISECFESAGHSFSSVAIDLISNSSSLSIAKFEESEDGSEMLPLVGQSSEDVNTTFPQIELDNGLDAEVYDRLREVHIEAENSKHEAYKESVKRQKAERDAIEALRRAKILENMHAKEMNRRKEVEESLASEKMEVEMLMNQRDEIIEQLHDANRQKFELELRITDSDNALRDFEEKLLEAQHLINTLKGEHEELQLQRDATIKEIEELRQNKEIASTSNSGLPNFSEFSLSEIEGATCNFSDLLKIGEGGYGTVYRGSLRNTTVAIKRLNPESMQGQSEFHQEVRVLSRVRHPNLITLIGVCSEIGALVYEYLPKGSLEDCLECKDNTAPLTWQARTRITTEICSALIFLHSGKPHPIVHGDLKPENILLDANLVSKLGDFGICRLLIQSTTSNTLFHHTHPKGTFVYMDPEYLATGELTPRSDVYSFGIVILRLLTGKQPFGIVREVKDALDKDLLHEIIDSSAGDWPFVQAKQLVHLGLRCCEISRKNRPDLVGDVWRMLEPMMKAASLSVSLNSSGSIMDDNVLVPNYFICPIFQEIMRDPHIASDGFTYEAEAIKGWIDGGHNTSPMTNLMLPNSDLIPNRALRSTIQEWLQQHLQS